MLSLIVTTRHPRLRSKTGVVNDDTPFPVSTRTFSGLASFALTWVRTLARYGSRARVRWARCPGVLLTFHSSLATNRSIRSSFWRGISIPSESTTLKPLYSGGLWLAVMTSPGAVLIFARNCNPGVVMTRQSSTLFPCASMPATAPSASIWLEVLPSRPTSIFSLLKREATLDPIPYANCEVIRHTPNRRPSQRLSNSEAESPAQRELSWFAVAFISRGPEDITLFKSGGLAVLDAIAADHIQTTRLVWCAVGLSREESAPTQLLTIK